MKPDSTALKPCQVKLEQTLIQTAVGKIALYYQRQPFRIWRIQLPEEHALEDNPPTELFSELAAVVGMIERYFQGNPLDTPWEIMELGSLTPLRRQVLAQTALIPFGSVKSYREVAQAIQRPKACRFVGNTLALNPFPILIPCHRVIRSDGKIGKFGGGSPLKEWLINMERRV